MAKTTVKALPKVIRPPASGSFDVNIDPNQLRRALALEGQIVSPDQFGVTDARGALDKATGGYRAKYLAGFDIPQKAQTFAGTVAPDVNATRADLEKTYAGSVDPNSPDYVDPSNILSLVSGRMQGGRDYLSRVTSAVGNIWDKGVQASRFGVEDATTALTGKEKSYNDKLTRARALIGDVSAENLYQKRRQEGLTDYEKKLEIAGRYQKSGSGDAPTGFEESLAAARQAIDQGADSSAVAARLYGVYPKQRTVIDAGLTGAGFVTTPGQSSGLNFFGPGRTPMTAEQYSASTGKDLTSVLAPSQNSQDVGRVGQITAIKTGTDPASIAKKFATQNKTWLQRLFGQ